jgi:hypothetical protein
MSLLRSFDHPATQAVAAIGVGLDELADANVWSMPAGELARLLVSVERLARRLAAAQVMLLRQGEAALVAEHEGATSLPVWLRTVADVPIGATKARLRLGRALGSHPATSDAFSAGDISQHAATAVCAAVDTLPGEVPAALTGRVEALLVDVAKDEGAKAVVTRVADIVHRFAPDQLEATEAAEAAANRLKLTQRHDGTLAVRGLFDRETAALALAVLGAHAAPAPALDGTPDFRDAESRYADAFVRVLQLASVGSPLTRGERPHIVVTVGLDTLRQTPGSAPGLLDTGAVISAGAARRLACDATVIPLVLGTAGEPLDLGRAARLIPAGLRRALAARDRGCAMPGCDRPPGWCDAHHLKHWADGGPTSVTNAALLCERHHGVVHRDGWVIEIADGRPWFTPPTWIDPTRTPRLHSRYRIRQLDP